MLAYKLGRLLDTTGRIIPKLSCVVDTGSGRPSKAADLNPSVRKDGGAVRTTENYAAAGRDQLPLMPDHEVKGLQIPLPDRAERGQEL